MNSNNVGYNYYNLFCGMVSNFRCSICLHRHAVMTLPDKLRSVLSGDRERWNVVMDSAIKALNVYLIVCIKEVGVSRCNYCAAPICSRFGL